MMTESLRQRPEVRALMRLQQDPEAGLTALEHHPASFRACWNLQQQGANEQVVIEDLMGQAWHTMSQDSAHFHRWLTWWADRWSETVIRSAEVSSPGNEALVRLLRMAVWCRPSPAIPDGQPWGEPLLRFWRRLADHGTGWFERPAMGSSTSQIPELDNLGFNPTHDTVTSALGVAVAHGRGCAVQAWEALSASWVTPPQGQKSWAVPPILVALVRPDAMDQPVVQALGTPQALAPWSLGWGHANTVRHQALGWKPDWLQLTARGTLWDVAVQHPDARLNEHAYRSLLNVRPSARQKIVQRSGLPEAVLNAHLSAAEALVLRDHWPSEPLPSSRPRSRL